jgi:hypothetical protein
MMAESRGADERTTRPDPQPGLQGQAGLAAIRSEKMMLRLAEQFDVRNHVLV